MTLYLKVKFGNYNTEISLPLNPTFGEVQNAIKFTFGHVITAPPILIVLQLFQTDQDDIEINTAEEINKMPVIRNSIYVSGAFRILSGICHY